MEEAAQASDADRLPNTYPDKWIDLLAAAMADGAERANIKAIKL